MSTADLVESVRTHLSLFVEHEVVQAAIVLLIALGVARLMDLVISRVVVRLVLSTRSTLDDELVELLHRPLFTTVLLLGLLLALQLVAPTELVGRIGGFFVSTLIVVLWTVFGIRASRVIIHALAEDTKRFSFIQPATCSLFDTTATLVLLAAGAYFALVIWGIDPIGWIATAGVAAVALGLAAQDMLGNLFGGIQILADAPYKVGDYIVLESQERGVVSRIGLRSTRIITDDDIEVTIPNSVIARSKVINETAGRWIKQRMAIPVGVAYGSDAVRVKAVLLEALAGVPEICPEPAPWVQFKSFGNSSLDFVLMCWIEEAAKRARILGEINTAIYGALGRHGIEIPFPKRDVYIKELPQALLARSAPGTRPTAVP